MGIPLSSLSPKLGSSVASSDIFLISNSDSSQDNKITQDEFSKSFTGFYAQNGQGLTIFENGGSYGLSVSGTYGFVGINDRSPDVSLDVADNVTSSNGSGQIRISTLNSGRKIALSLRDPNTYYEFSKKANDTKLYLESSVNAGSTFTNLFVVDQSGNFGITNSTSSLTDKFLVSGASIQFQNSGNAIYFDPYNTEIKTSATDEVLLLNYNNLGNVNVGKNGVFVKNNSTAPYVAIGHYSPDTTLHISGVDKVAKLQSSSTTVFQGFKNSVNDAFIGLNSNKFYFGPSSGLSNYNVVYNMAGDGTFGLGTNNPLYTLDVLGTGPTNNTLAHFQTTGAKTIEIGIGSNKVLGGGDTGPRNSFVTFSRYDSTADVDKWSIGNLYVDPTFGGSDDFVFIANGYYGASPNVVAKLTTAGSLDIDGSFTTNSSYCKGHFIEVYNSRLTGLSNLYIDPFGFNGSSAISSGNFNNDAPFGVSMYNGKLERVKLFTSSTVSTNVAFQFYAITPTTTSVSGYNNIGTTGDFTNVKCSGLLALNANQVSEIIFPTFGSFTSGQLLQYRLFKSDYTPLNIPVTVTSSLKYIVV
jgi:hypothetical protein